MSRRDEKSELPQGTFLPTIDYDLAIWMAYQNCVNMSIMARHENDFANAVTILTSMILPDWQDEKYRNEVKKKTDPRVFFKAITNLLHRRHFFDKPTKNMGHL